MLMNNLVLIKAKQLEDIVITSTCRYFDITGLLDNFLDKEVDMRTKDDDYKFIRKTVRCMRVVNDIAEHGVALMEEYNKLYTTN